MARRIRATDRVILRDGALRQVPGRSRAADHVHHVVPRSACEPHEPWNELSVCAVHHLRGVHAGNVRIAGKAPDGLHFTLGEREVAAAPQGRRGSPPEASGVVDEAGSQSGWNHGR